MNDSDSGTVRGGEYLSQGFRDVDQTEDLDAYVTCLALLDSLPHFIQYKAKSYELLELSAGLTVLDAGCGLGDDTVRMAQFVRPGGRVVGIDSSARMIEKARSQHSCSRLPVHFEKGDVRDLPFSDCSFGRCRIDRVLQHVTQPEKAVFELCRVLEPGGILLAYDNDWGTFSITSQNPAITGVIENFWSDSFTNSRIGRDLGDLFIAAGLSDVKAYPQLYTITDYEIADRVYNIGETVRRAQEAGLISRTQGSLWLDECAGLSARGRFGAALTAYTVIGRKDGG